MDKISELKKYHSEVGPKIKARLEEFADAGRGDENEIFKEMCFCVLTANTSAEMSLAAVDVAGEAMLEGDAVKISLGLVSSGYRYPNKRAEYIACNKEKTKEGLKKKIDSCTDAENLRSELVKNVKGFGYKEASHFLRNIGFKGLAILDKHIISSLAELGVITENSPPKNRGEYLKIEGKMRVFSEEIGIDMDELDLLLWSRKTGKILK